MAMTPYELPSSYGRNLAAIERLTRALALQESYIRRLTEGHYELLRFRIIETMAVEIAAAAAAAAVRYEREMVKEKR